MADVPAEALAKAGDSDMECHFLQKSPCSIPEEKAR